MERLRRDAQAAGRGRLELLAGEIFLAKEEKNCSARKFSGALEKYPARDPAAGAGAEISS
jgi:hypothetical protein